MLHIAPPRTPTRRICGAEIAPLSRASAVALLRRFIRMGGHAKIAFANAHFVNLAVRDGEFRRAMTQFVVLPDGVGVDMAARFLYGACFPANLNGTDFLPYFLREHANSLRVALIGARPGVAEKAVATLSALAPQHRFVALSDGFMTPEREAEVLTTLASDPVDVLLVAMGNPVQEKWIARNISAHHTRLAFGVGALFDFLAGEVARAPALVRTARLEWMWRLAQEPTRLWRRYILGNPMFLLRVLRQKMWSTTRPAIYHRSRT